VKKVVRMRARYLTRCHLRLIRFAERLSLTGFFALAMVFASHRAAGQPSVLTQHNDNARTGQNTNETLLNTSNVNVNDFGLVFSLPVQGQVYAQPLFVPNVTINGTTHDVLIVATEQENVYAFDADAPAAPLWSANMVDTLHGASSNETAVPSLTTIGCKDLQPYIGITSTPVIDPESGTIYLEAKSTDGTNYFHRLHALDLTTGAEKPQGPVVITATVSGTGDGSANGQLAFDSFHELNRPGLLLLDGTIYLGFASHCDFSPYHGWLFAYDAATFTQQSAFVTTPNGGMGGFWQSGAGIAADPSGNIYTSSGNGSFDTTNVPPIELGDTLMKFGTAGGQLSLQDYFTPSDEGCLSTKDLDLGSGGVLVLPDQPGANPHILVTSGKEGAVYVVNRDQMTTGNSHFENSNNCTTSDPEILEETPSGWIGRLFGLPAYWNNTLYFAGAKHSMSSIPLVNGRPNFKQISNNTTAIPYPGGTPSISSNGTTAGTAILWVVDASHFISSSAGVGPAILHAFDATNINNELWNSTQAPNNRDAAGDSVKFAVPTVVSGKVYVGTTDFVNVYGLFNAITFPALPNVTYGAPPIALTATASSGLAMTYSVTGPATVSGSTLTITGAGTVTVTASQAGNKGYVAATPVSQSFTVAQAPLTVTANNFTLPYGQPISGLTGYNATGFVNGDTSTVLSGAPAESTTATQGSDAGIYPITITQGTLAAANYFFTFVGGTLTISGGVAQTITFPAPPSLTYGTRPILLAATSNSGLAVSYAVSGPAKLSGSMLTITGAGAVKVTASQAGNNDYAAATPMSQSLTVARAALTVKASNATRIYGAVNPTFTYTITGFVKGETAALVSGDPREATTASIASPPGSYPISFSTAPLKAANYTFNYVDGMLTVKPAVLSVKVDNAAKVYGTSNPIFISNITGLQNGDNMTLTYRTTARVTSPVGVYPITATVSGPAATNYAIQLTGGELTIVKAKLIIEVKNSSRFYDEPNPAFSGTVKGMLSGDKITIAYTTEAKEESPVGKYPITAMMSGSSAANYTPDVKDGTLTVKPAPLPAPTFSPKGERSSEAVIVTISDKASGAMIFYTKDGTAPTPQSNKYNGPVTVSKSETLKAIATAPNHRQSPIGTAVYTIRDSSAPSD